MARKKTPKVRYNVKALISSRLREVRQDLFGEHGGPELARRLNLPARTWYNYETGVTVPAEVLLNFIEQTGTNPIWLLSGEGPKYRRSLEDLFLTDMSPSDLIRRGLEKLEQQQRGAVLAAPEGLPDDQISDFVAVGVVPMSDLAERSVNSDGTLGYVFAYRPWLPHPSETIGVQVEDDAMSPVLPIGSIAAIDLSVTEPERLQGRLVAACPEGRPMIRWLELSGRHLILRPNQPSRQHPMIPLERDEAPAQPIIGQVIWSWSRFTPSPETRRAEKTEFSN